MADDKKFTEDAYEQTLIALFRDELGYAYECGYEVERDYREPFHRADLVASMRRLNPSLPADAMEQGVKQITNISIGTLEQNNEQFTLWMQNGLEVGYLQDGEERTALMRLIDFERPERNLFKVVNQWCVEEYKNKRCDMVVMVNGLPLVVVELKSAVSEDATIYDAYKQIKNYQQSVPSLFSYNAFNVISDMSETRAGTITAKEARYMEWKTVDGSYESTLIADYRTFFLGMFQKQRLLDILQNYICFDKNQGRYAKILTAYHQYYAVGKALERTKEAVEGNGKIGVFWHTQGSGKSLSMVFLAHLLEEKLDSPTIVVITDRNDLDSQLFAQFSRCSDFLRQTPVQAQSRADLAQQISSRRANGIIFTTMQKFEEEVIALSERKNVVVMVDEAHRGQYGFEEKYDRDGKKHTGTALLIRRALPNATFIGFTGTPISAEDRSTREVFGDYIDVYDMTQAVEDDATRPVFYESRVVALKLDQGILAKVDDEYEKLTEQANAETIDASKRNFANLDAVLGAPEVIDALCQDIVEHYETNRAHELTGKAMIVAYSRPTAMAIYQRICELRPSWKDEGKLGVVMTMGNQDPEWWFDVVGNKAHVKEMAKRFKDDADPLKIVIVVDMWLTGFDVPSLATMYVYKPMRGYNLMQAIARVNRVYKDKVGGLVVDYVGIANALKRAMKDYTKRDQKKYGDMDIGKTAYPKFLEKLAVCRDKMFGYDYSEFMSTESAARRSELITGGVNHILAPGDEDITRDFVEQAGVMLKAYGLAKSRATDMQRIEAGYFQVVRELILQLTEQGGTRSKNGGKLTLKQVNDRINALLEQNIVHTDGVIDLFKVEDETVSIFDPKFLSSLSRMKERNLAYELLKKLIDDQIKGYRRKSITQAKKYSELMQSMVNGYLNGQLTNAEVFEEMLKMAKEMLSENQKAKALGLSEEEFAFYEALTQPQAVADYYRERNDELVAITQELAAKMREMRTVDWQKKQSARAAMRVAIKRLLKHHKYPPEGMESALATVMDQCELWADNAA